MAYAVEKAVESFAMRGLSKLPKIDMLCLPLYGIFQAVTRRISSPSPTIFIAEEYIARKSREGPSHRCMAVISTSTLDWLFEEESTGKVVVRIIASGTVGSVVC